MDAQTQARTVATMEVDGPPKTPEQELESLHLTIAAKQKHIEQLCADMHRWKITVGKAEHAAKALRRAIEAHELRITPNNATNADRELWAAGRAVLGGTHDRPRRGEGGGEEGMKTIIIVKTIEPMGDGLEHTCATHITPGTIFCASIGAEAVIRAAIMENEKRIERERACRGDEG